MPAPVIPCRLLLALRFLTFVHVKSELLSPGLKAHNGGFLGARGSTKLVEGILEQNLADFLKPGEFLNLKTCRCGRAKSVKNLSIPQNVLYSEKKVLTFFLNVLHTDSFKN